jgi:hypothetical protein
MFQFYWLGYNKKKTKNPNFDVKIYLHGHILSIVANAIIVVNKIIKKLTQEKILGFSITRIHYVFNEMGQSSPICNLHGFGKKMTS